MPHLQHPRTNAATAARSKKAQDPQEELRNEPIPWANSNKMQPLAPCTKRTHFLPKTAFPQATSSPWAEGRQPAALLALAKYPGVNT